MKETVDLRAYGTLLWRRRWVVFVPMLVAGLVGYVVTLPRFMRPVYECSATMMVEFPRPMTKELAGLVANPSMEERLARMQSQIQSNEFLKTLITNTNMRSDPWVQSWANNNQKRYPDLAHDDLVDLWLVRYLRGAIGLSASKRGSGNVIEIAIADYYPERARNLVQNLCAGVIEASRAAQIRMTQGTEDFSTSQLNEYRTKLSDAESRLERFQASQAAKRVRPSLVTDAIQGKAEELRRQARADQERERSNLAAAAALLGAAGVTPGRVDGALESAGAGALLGEARGLEESYARQTLIEAASPGMTSQTTALQIARAAAGLREQVRAALQGMSSLPPEARQLAESYLTARVALQLATARLQVYDREFATFSDRLTSAPEADIELRRLQQQVESYRTLYNAFVTQLSSSQISQAYEASQMGERISVLEPPQRPLKPVKPKRVPLVAMSVMMGLALGVLAAFVLEHHDQTFRDVRDLEDALAIKVIGTVPNLPGLRKGKVAGRAAPPKEFFPAFLDDSPGYREFRRTALSLLRASEGGPSTILLTSARGEEGKSTAATCLALALAKELPRERVLLIDLDMRKPSLYRVLDLGTENGDVSRIIRDRRFNEAASHSLFLPNFSVLPTRSGNELALEGITQDAFTWLLPELKRHADRIIIDGPPNLPVPDPLVIGPMVDAVLLVVKAGETPRETVRRSLELQRRFHDNVWGALMNNVAEVLPYYYHYSHYGDGYQARG